VAGAAPPKLLWGIRQELIVGSLFDHEVTAFRVAQDQGKRVRMIEAAVLDDGEQSIVETFWAMRRLAGKNADEVVSLRDMLDFMALDDWQRDELEILRALDHAYVETITTMAPKRREQLAKKPSHLSIVKTASEEED
jgi:hypothetical protein